MKHAINKKHEYVISFIFKILSNGLRVYTKKRKVAETLLIGEIKPTFNIQEQSLFIN